MQEHQSHLCKAARRRDQEAGKTTPVMGAFSPPHSAGQLGESMTQAGRRVSPACRYVHVHPPPRRCASVHMPRCLVYATITTIYLLLSAHRTFIKMCHVLDHKENFSKSGKVEILQSMSSDPVTLKLDTIHKDKDPIL